MFEECLYFNTASLARSLERLWSKAFAQFGLTPSQGFMLRMIVKEGKLLPSELADALNISRPTATRIIGGLIRSELVERVSADDGRETIIKPTQKALDIYEGLNQASGALTSKFKSELGEDSFKDFVKSARAINRTL